MKRILFTCFLVAVLFVIPTNAKADLVSNNVTVDLTTSTITTLGSGEQLLQIVPNIAIPLMLPTVGDVLDTTVTFTTGQKLTITDTGAGAYPFAGNQLFSQVFRHTDHSISGAVSTTTTSVTFLRIL